MLTCVSTSGGKISGHESVQSSIVKGSSHNRLREQVPRLHLPVSSTSLSVCYSLAKSHSQVRGYPYRSLFLGHLSSVLWTAQIPAELVATAEDGTLRAANVL